MLDTLLPSAMAQKWVLSCSYQLTTFEPLRKMDRGSPCLPLLSSRKHSCAGSHLDVFTAHPKEKDSKLDKINKKLPTVEGMWKATDSNGMLGICLRAAGGAATQHSLESIQQCAKQVTGQGEISHTQNRFDLRILFRTSRTNEVIIYKFFYLVNAF